MIYRDFSLSGIHVLSGIPVIVCAKYDLEYNLTSEETDAVSDHYPVYAEFVFDSTEA
ncbi:MULTISPECIES: hypothetical protein [Methanosarcina]|uniref:hypothetical protein n=1 Tax=Methanosarcina TaxID=2207 RepID=UPI000ABE04CD|nr:MULTISPECIES: hypothetical protein [Methanosarcina]